MSGLYPSLEDLKVDQMAKAQVATAQIQYAVASSQASGAVIPAGLYAGLGLEELMQTYGGLDISAAAISRYVSPEVAAQLQPYAPPIASITPMQDENIVRASVKQGIREVVLCKDQKGKIGAAVKAIDKGLFVSFIWRDSPAAMSGMRFGDQILQINGESVAGWSTDKATSVLKKADGGRISVVIRDRPFDRTITVVKDSNNQIGFLYKDGEISAIVKDSSAARNGLLINHHIVEVNGQNVVGMKDDDLLRVFKDADRSVTLTIMPTFVFDHLVKHIGSSDMKKFMDRSIPDV